MNITHRLSKDSSYRNISMFILRNCLLHAHQSLYFITSDVDYNAADGSQISTATNLTAAEERNHGYISGIAPGFRKSQILRRKISGSGPFSGPMARIK